MNRETIDVEVETVDVEKEIKKTLREKLKINRHWNKFMRILPIVSVMAFLLCGFLANGWVWSWTFLLVTPFAHMFVSLLDKKLKTIMYVLFSMMVLAGIVLIGVFVPHGWTWSWVLAFLIPIFGILVE